MAVDAASVPGASASDNFKASVDRLKNDSNATPAYKQQLDAWLKQLDSARGDATAQQAPGGAGMAAQQPGAAVAAPAGAGQASAPAQPRPRSAPGTQPGPAKSADAPASGDVLSGSSVPQALKDLAPAIQKASQQSGTPKDELAAVIWAESRGKAGASTTNGGNGMSDSGLMQINPATFGQLQAGHPELQGKTVSDPGTNVMAGADLLADAHQQFGSWDLAQRGYNSGVGSVDKNNPDATTTGLGDPNYNQKVDGIKAALDGGQALPS